MLNISVYIYCVTCCSCFSQLSLLVLLYFLYFSVFLLLLEYVKLDNSFYYQVLIEVCMFLIIFIFIILSMFVCILCFCRIYRKKKKTAGRLLLISSNILDISLALLAIADCLGPPKRAARKQFTMFASKIFKITKVEGNIFRG